MNNTIDFFYEISKIPRESGNEKGISNYLCEFAEKRNLYYEKDKYNNVIIKKKTSNKIPIILQAHMDMVCEKNNNINFDFKNDSIQIIEENGYLRANGTTLGADNGIGVAQILNILDSDSDCNIEAIFTVSEETTMIGAENIDLSKIEGRQLISLDGFEENTIIIESASFFDIILKMNYKFENSIKNKIYTITLSGLYGGHSGFDIDKNRGNASVILSELLNKISDIELFDFVGGTKFNVIPSTSYAMFASSKPEDEIKNIINDFLCIKRMEYEELNISLEKNIDLDSFEVLDNSQSIKFIETILKFKHGVFNKNTRNEVTTSINLGVVDLKNQVIKIGMRSSKKDEEHKCLKYMEQYSLENDLDFTIIGSQPGFDTPENSKLVENLKKAYKSVDINEKLNIKSVHITVETGFFKDKINDLDVAIISPKILNAHTTKECVNIASVYKCDKWLQNFLNIV